MTRPGADARFVNRFARIAATAALVSVAATAPAVARPGDRPRPERPVRTTGQVTAVDADSVTVGETDIAVGSRTRFASPRRIVRSVEDLRIGDTVQVVSRAGTAQRIRLRLLAFEGTATAADDVSLTLDVDDANKVGDAYLGDETSVTVDVLDTTRFDDDLLPVAGDEVEVVARVSAEDETVLEALTVEVEEPETETETEG